MAIVNKVLFTVSVVLLFSSACFATRTVNTSFQSYKQDSIAYIHAKGDKDALHYLITTIGLPTVLVAHTAENVHLEIDWERFTSGNQSEMANSIMFTPSKDVYYSYAVVFTRLIEYNDTKDKADLNTYGIDDVAWNSYEFANFTWENMTAQSSAKQNMVLFNATRTNEEIWSQNGSFTLKFTAYDHDGREPDLPHLQFNENITQFDLTIDHLWTNLSSSRFALEAMMVSAGSTSMKIDETRSIDDEYSPGVFKINNWLSKTGNLDDTGFLQWKPVCYLKPARARSVATGMKHYKINKIDDYKEGLLNNTILFGFYGYNLSAVTRKAMNLSFGIGDDGGYNKTQYLGWSGSIGYGQPPEDKVSTLVIIVISVGLGLPVVIILLGGVYVCTKKKNSNPAIPQKSVQDGYQPIANGQVES